MSDKGKDKEEEPNRAKKLSEMSEAEQEEAKKSAEEASAAAERIKQELKAHAIIGRLSALEYEEYMAYLHENDLAIDLDYILRTFGEKCVP